MLEGEFLALRPNYFTPGKEYAVQEDGLSTVIAQMQCREEETVPVGSRSLAVFWVVALRSLAEVYRRFSGPCYRRHQGDRLHTRRPCHVGITAELILR